MKSNTEDNLFVFFVVIFASLIGVGNCYANQPRNLTEKSENKKISILLNERKYHQSIRLINNEIKNNDAWAELNMGLLYKAGIGVNRSDKKAFYWFTVAAKNGDHHAARYVANAYLQGDGVHRNLANAANWFRVGIAPNQWAGGYCGLANTYHHGFFTHNPEKAAMYYHKCISTLSMLIKHDNGPSSEILGPLKFALG